MGTPLSDKSPPPPRRWQIRGYVLDRCDFNDIRMGLPRAVRRGVEAAPEGHVGLVAQAVVGQEGDVPLAVLYDNVPASIATEGMRKLEARLTEKLG